MPADPKDAIRAAALQPQSLTGHDVPSERLATIAPHIARLSASALVVSRSLPLQADVGDVFAVMAADADRLS